MRNVFTAFIAAFTIILGLLGGPPPAEASLTAGKAFSSLKGNTTIDSGGSVHSQTRSIYSLGGGMTTFKGKRVTLLAADPPSFSAGCSGISWHFGGFSFISMDELRQLVEAVAQASLGIAVDLAMQTLCPQCYAVMSKLRDMANMMRNAAADACRIATNLGEMVKGAIGLPDSKQTSCATVTSSEGKSDGFLASAAGSLCKGMDSVNNFLQDQADNVINFLNGSLGNDKTTPSRETLSKYFNVQYEMLSALGYEDGPIKDLMLNFMGMTIYYPEPVNDCSVAFKELRGDSSDQSGLGSASGRSSKTAADPNNIESKPAKSTASGSSKGIHACMAPPRISGVKDIGEKLVCGFDPAGDAKKFANAFEISISDVAATSIGAMCGLERSAGSEGNLVNLNQIGLDANPSLYTCDSDKNARCLVPSEKKYSELVGSSSGEGAGYTGLAWEIAHALYQGAAIVASDGKAAGGPAAGHSKLPDNTIAILNGSGYPLYRLLNMAAVYPGLAQDLLNAYAATIAVQYAVETIDKIARPGSMSALELKGVNAEIPTDDLMLAKSQIANMITEGSTYMDRTQKLQSQKRALVQSIIEVNRALQAEVITKGLSGNTGLALSIKGQLANAEQ